MAVEPVFWLPKMMTGLGCKGVREFFLRSRIRPAVRGMLAIARLIDAGMIFFIVFQGIGKLQIFRLQRAVMNWLDCKG